MRFEEATYDETHQAIGQTDARSREADSRLIVQFTEESWHNKEKSAQEGRPIYEPRVYVMIMVPGDKDSVIHRPASEMDYARFPSQYQRYQNKQDQRHANGTPLRSVSFLTASQVKELEYFNVYTVEQLSNVPDVHAQKFMGIHKLKQLANDFLMAARDMAPLTALRAEMETKDAQLAAQSQAIEELKKQVKEMKAFLETED